MKTQKSRNYLIQSYVGLITILLTLGGLTALTLRNFSGNSANHSKLWGILILAGLYMLFFAWKTLRIPEIEISKAGISIISGKEEKKIKWGDISDIDYHGRYKVLNLNREAILIKTKSSTKPVVIYYSPYSNANEIGGAIKSCRTAYQKGGTPDLKVFELPKIAAVSKDSLSSENFKYVSRVPLFSFYTYFALFIISGAIYAGRTQIPVKGANQIVALIMLLIFFILGLILGVLFMSKVGLSNRYLVIKNFYFPYRKVFRIEDIKEVIIERPSANNPRTSGMKGIRVVSKDGSRKIHTIMNFLDSDWEKLEKLLQEKKIPVQNYSRFNTRLLR